MGEAVLESAPPPLFDRIESSIGFLLSELILLFYGTFTLLQ